MRVIEAEGLISRDSNGRSDPFASVHVDGSTWRTKTIERTLAPVWSEEAKEPPITSADAVGHGILFDQDGMMKKSDYLGEVLIPVKLLADGAPHDHWLQLRSPAGHEVTGTRIGSSTAIARGVCASSVSRTQSSSTA